MELSDLPYAIDHRVVTRFPPEASGYLHLGHVKALMLNYLYAKKYHGKIILRFDDTNPDKENQLYEQAIECDIKTLDLDCDRVTYTSDYFDQLINYAKVLIAKDLAYIDEQSFETIQKERSEFKPSPYRENGENHIETNLKKFDAMCNGLIKDCCLRAKISFDSKNGAMRDPVIYRYKDTDHPRTGSKYKLYPTYDFACPIVDSLEGVTHTMRSVEFRDRDVQYNWFLDNLDLKYGDLKQFPHIKEYGKLNFSHTVLSKRKLAKLVDNGLVSGWDDPRMPTVRGILRRGMQIDPLKNYIKLQGFSMNIVMLTWDKIWAMNSEILSDKAVRLFGLDRDALIKIQIDGPIPSEVVIQNHPKNPLMGLHTMVMGSDLYVEKSDFVKININDRFTLIGLGNCTVTNLDPVILRFDPNDQNYKKTTKITYLSVDPHEKNYIPITSYRYPLLLTKPKLDDQDDILECFNKTVIKTDLFVESLIKDMPNGTIIQIMRKDYYRIDRNSSTNEMILINIPVR